MDLDDLTQIHTPADLSHPHFQALLNPSGATSDRTASLIAAGVDKEALMVEMGKAMTPGATTALMDILAMGERAKTWEYDTKGQVSINAGLQGVGIQDTHSPSRHNDLGVRTLPGP